jgi:hypothetical protein
MQGPDVDPAFYKPIISISIPPAQREAFYNALLTLRQREQRPFVSLSALVVKAVIAAAGGQVPSSEEEPDATNGADALGNGTF